MFLRSDYIVVCERIDSLTSNALAGILSGADIAQA